MDRRVAVTGIGLVTPLGTGVDKTWSALCSGKSGISRISRFDSSDFKTTIAGEVKDFNPSDFLPKKEAKRTELFIAYAVAASRMAIEGGVLRSENADMSNDKPGEIPGRRKPEVSWAMLVIPGLVGT